MRIDYIEISFKNFVRIWETPEPNEKDFANLPGHPVVFLNKLSEWRQSFKEVELFHAHYLQLKELMWEHWKDVHESDSEAEFLEMQDRFKNGGFTLPESIASRIQIGKFCCQTGLPCGAPCNGPENCQEYAVLTPLPAQENETKVETLEWEVKGLEGNEKANLNRISLLETALARSLNGIKEVIDNKEPTAVLNIVVHLQMIYLELIDLKKVKDKIRLAEENEKALLARVRVLEDLLRFTTNWPLNDVLGQLVKATDILLIDKSYDGGTYEEMEQCSKIGKELIANINTFIAQGKALDFINSPTKRNDLLINSTQLIGRVKERHKELFENYQHDYKSFYSGWLEGRVDLVEILKKNKP